MAMIILLDLNTEGVNTIKVKVVRHVRFLGSSEQLIFNKNESLAILDLRSIGYYKVMQSKYSAPPGVVL